MSGNEQGAGGAMSRDKRKGERQMTRKENMTREAAIHTLRQLCDNLVKRCEEYYDPNEILRWIEGLLALRTETYFIGNAGNGNFFVVPTSKRADWFKWVEGQEDADPKFPVAPPPAWATFINGPTNVVEFCWDGKVRRDE